MKIEPDAPGGAPNHHEPARPERPAPRMGRRELLVFLGLSTSLVALGIDVMLPAFDEIRAGLDLADGSTAVTGLVTFYFLGLACGTLIWGPIADRHGRRTALQAGLLVYALGTVAAALSPSIAILFLARFVWGFGAAGPRTVAMAVVRDRFEGDEMSRAMSSLMAIFLTVPIVAPSLGAVALSIMSFRGLFLVCGGAAVLVSLWGLRLVETLRPDDKLASLRFSDVRRSATIVVSHRRSVLLTLAVVALFAGFQSFLGTAELIFSDVLDQESAFPLWFGASAGVMAIAALTGGRLVRAFGMARVMHTARRLHLVLAAAMLTIALVTGGAPPVLGFVIPVALVASAQAILIPTLNTSAMEPLGRVAGTASSLIGAAQTAGGTLLAAVLDRFYDGTVIPLAVGFLLAGVAMNLAVRSATRDERVDSSPRTSLPRVSALGR